MENSNQTPNIVDTITSQSPKQNTFESKVSKPSTSTPISANVRPNTSSLNQKNWNRKLSSQNLTPKHSTASNERPLKCLETLAQKAGITFDETTSTIQVDTNKTTSKQNNYQFIMEKTQNSAQQLPIQISSEQYQQLQHQYQLQQAFAAGGTGSIQVKQEFPQQTITAEQLKHQLQEQQNQASAHQVQQMQLIETATASPGSNNTTMGIKYVNGGFK